MCESRLALTRVAVLALLVSPLALAAQGEKVSIRPMPAPNQTIRVKMTQDMKFEVTMVGVPAGVAVPDGPMKAVGTTVFEGTQTVASPDADGRVSSDFIYDQVVASMTMNGIAVPSQPGLDALKGKRFTMVFDAQGKIVDFKLPDDLAATMPNLGEMIKTMMGDLPAVSLGVGETATVPLNLSMPLPVPGDASMKMVGQRTFTLVSVDRAGGERIASLEQHFDAKMTHSMAMPGPNGSATMTVDFVTMGMGTSRWNLDRGYLSSSAVDSTIDGTMTGPIGMTIHGTTRMAIESAPIR